MPSKWKKGWKVLDKDRTSVWIGSLDSYGSRKYLPDKVVGRSPNCGPLCVFKNRASALSFMIPGEKLVPCLYLPSKHTSVWIKWGIRKPLAIAQKGLLMAPLESLPDYTALAEKVMCLE